MPHARRTDPHTSHVAAASAESLASSHRALIYKVMHADFATPMASEQVAERAGLTHAQTWRRMSELEAEKRIVRTDEKHQNISGRWAYKYKVVITPPRKDAVQDDLFE